MVKTVVREAEATLGAVVMAVSTEPKSSIPPLRHTESDCAKACGAAAAAAAAAASSSSGVVAAVFAC